MQLMPSYIGLNRIIYASSSYSAYTDAASVSWNPDVSGGIYPFGPHGPSTPPEQLDALLRQGREVVDVRPEGATFAVRDVGRLMSKRAEQRGDFPAEIASSVWISTARTANESDELVLLFQWHVMSALTEDANAVIELRDADGRVVQRYDGYPLSGVSAPRLWVAGDRIDDSVAFPMPARGVYSIWAGMRSVDTDQPLPVTPGPEGAPVEFNMVEVGTFDSR